MKQLLILTSITLFFFGNLITANAQFKDGDLVKIKNVKAGKYAQPENFSRIANAKIVIFSLNNSNSQYWKVIAQKGGYYKFQNVNSSWYLGVLNSSRALNAELCQKINRNQSDLLWKLEKSETGYKLKNKNSNLVAAVYNGAFNNNAKLIQFTDNPQPDAIWQFEAAGSKDPSSTGKKVLFDITLNYLAVSEATRNRIDNGDCKRIFGSVSTELWELDDDNEMKIKLRSYNNMPEVIFNQTNWEGPPTVALSYYQDDRNASANRQMGKVTYNVPQNLFNEKKLMLVVKTNLGTRHKDNDFASYDALKMGEEVQNTYIIGNQKTRDETIETITDLASTDNAMNMFNFIIPGTVFIHADDTHKIWVKFSTKIN